MSARRRLRALLPACLLFLLALCCAACEEGPPATEVLVVVDGAASTRAALVRLEVQVFKGRELGGPKQMIQVDVGQQGHAWPISFSIAANTQNARDEFRVVITGFDANQTAIVEQQAITNFQPNRAGRLDLYLYAGCAGLCRAEGSLGAQTCGADGQCTSVPVLSMLPEADPGKLGGYAPVTMEPGAGNPEHDGSQNDPNVPGEAGSGALPDADTRTGSDGSVATATPADGGVSTTPAEAGSAQPDAGVDGGPADAGREAGPLDGSSEASAPKDAEQETGPAYSADPVIPTPSVACPSFASGTATIMGVSVQILAGAKSSGAKAPLIFYWHGTGATGSQLTTIPASVRNEIVSAGGMIVAPDASAMGGSDISGNAVWYESELELSDLVVGCAVRDYNIDPRRIYTMGCSTGGLAAGVMGFRRARYVAAGAPNSGGLFDAGVAYTEPGASRVARVMTMHGGSSDMVIYSFTTLSLDLCRATSAAGALAIDCDHGGGHCGAPVALQEAAWRFMKDHPYGLATEPYGNGLPADFPSYCRIVTSP
jgi:hypothetical protein